MSPMQSDLFTDEQRWHAVRSRDATADGVFYYSVATTGVYCRPSCAARLALRQNVAFHATPDEAEKAGFRACKRCHPRDASPAERQAAVVARACQTIEEADETPTLAALANAAGLSRFHFQRMFKRIAGVSPKEYAGAHRARRVKDELGQAQTVTEAIYAAGYGSNSRFYEKADSRLGMPPAAYRAGGRGAAIRFAVGECSLGSILVAATDKGVCAIELGDDPAELVRSLQDRFPRAELVGGDAPFERLVARVVGQIERPAPDFELPLDVRGTAFQERVWRALRDVPAGRTATYADIARRVGSPRAVRAVAQACGANPAAVAIPCHRVIRTDGDLSGYRWGVERKRALLRREASGDAV